MIKFKQKLNEIVSSLGFKEIQSNKFMFNLKIDIEKIRYFLKTKNTLNRYNFIWDGNWDKKKLKLSKYRKNNINYNSMFQIYKENMDYSKCDEFKFKSKQIFLGKKTPRGNTLTELDNYFQSLDKLKNSLNKLGYKSQKNFKNQNKNDEIGVVIGRNGEIIKLEDNFGGTHRFALCKILKIKKIIVSIKAVHKSLLNQNDIRKTKTKYEKLLFIKSLKKKINY